MEQLGGGGGGGGGGGDDSIGNRILNHHRSPPTPSDRLLGVFQPQSSSAAPPLELSEHDIFSSPSGSSSPSNVDPSHIPSPTQNASNRNKSHGILAALNDNMGTKSGSGTGTGARPVFNHKASTSASLSSSSTSPAASFSSRIMIPRRPPPLPQVDRIRLLHQSAPVKVPVIPEAMRRRAMELDEVLSEKDEEEENGVILPPHEVVAARNSPMLSFSVLEGAGRTLKGRDLRQVRNAIWRKTGFIGIQILVKCDKLKKLAVAYTEEDGSFETELPSNDQKSRNPMNCIAKIMGGSQTALHCIKELRSGSI